MQNSSNMKKLVFITILMTLVFYIFFASSDKLIDEKFDRVDFIINSSQINAIEDQYYQELLKLNLGKNFNLETQKIKNLTVLSFNVLLPNQKSSEYLNDLINNQSKDLIFYFANSRNIVTLSGQIVVFTLVFVFVFFIWFYFVSSKEAPLNKRLWKTISKNIVIAYLSLAALSGILVLIFKWFDNSFETDIQGIESIIVSQPLLSFYLIAILAPMTEELLFRGLFFRYFLNKGHNILGVIIVNIEFVSAHYYLSISESSILSQIYLITILLFLSTACCWVYKKINMVIAPILLHTLNNTIAFFIIYFF